MYEGKKNFYCSSHDCNFALWKESRYLVGMKKDVGSENGKGTFRAWENRVTDFYSQMTERNLQQTYCWNCKGTGQALKWNFQKENRKKRRECSWENSMRFWGLPNMKRKKSAVLQEIGCIIWILHHNCTVTLFLIHF
ncbi:hypothetical protein MYD03_19210 [Mediterraneibacter gnavus]